MNPTTPGGLNQAQQEFVNNWLKSAQSAVQQPAAQLQQTQAQTGEAGAEAGAAAQSAATSAQEEVNLQAQNPGVQATTKSEQIKALKDNAPLNLGVDLTKNSMTLPSAIKKYKALGMSADDIFHQYLAQSPWGTPNQDPQQLQELGVTKAALGDIGTPGSFMDKYNTKNAVDELRNAQELWNQTSSASRLPFLSNYSQSAQAYQTAKQVVGEHLSSLIPGASGAQSSVQDLLGILPDTGDLSLKQENSGADTAKFNTLEQQLLASKGYSYKDLGLPAPKIPPKSGTGGDLISSLLGQVINPVTNATTATGQQDAAMPSGKGDLLQSIINSAQMTGNLAKNTVGNPAILGEAASVATLPDTLAAGAGIPAFLAKLGGKGVAKEAATVGTDNLPGALKTFLNPKGAIAQAGDVRDAVVGAAAKAGKTVDGDSLLADITSWSQKAKLGNLGQGKAIDRAVTDAEGILKGNKLDPQDLMKAYNEADSGFTANGIPKTPIQANIDRGLRDVLAKHLDDVAPGWKNSTTSMAKAYQAQKSPIRAGIKNLAKFGIPLAGGGAVGETLTHVLFPSGR